MQETPGGKTGRKGRGVGEKTGEKHSANDKQRQEHTNTQTRQKHALKEQLAKTLPASLATMDSQMCIARLKSHRNGTKEVGTDFHAM
jgi:hypothetical protein